MLTDFNWVILALVVLTFPWILKIFFPHKVSWDEAFVASVLSILCSFVFYHTGKHIQTLDYEIYSGEIHRKYRDNSQYTEFYSCNCNKDGCQTCSRQVYTSDWYAVSNIGEFNIDSERSYSSSVWSYPHPHRYVIIQNGDPVSKSVQFINYVKAVPENIFNKVNMKGEFTHLVPNYPDIYDIYNINRFFTVMDKNVFNNKYWNDKLSKRHNIWGYKYQTNVLVVITDKPIAFAEDLKAKWLLGKQNDLIIVVGLDSQNQIDWVDASGWSENEEIKFAIQSGIMDLKNLNNPDAFYDVIDSKIKNGYKYRDMEKDFEHLKDLIKPPLWVVILAYILSFGISIWMIFYNLGEVISQLINSMSKSKRKRKNYRSW